MFRASKEIRALRFGAFGCMGLGVFMTLVTLATHGLGQPMSFVGSGSIFLMGAAFWLFMKNAEATTGKDKD